MISRCKYSPITTDSQVGHQSLFIPTVNSVLKLHHFKDLPLLVNQGNNSVSKKQMIVGITCWTLYPSTKTLRTNSWSTINLHIRDIYVNNAMYIIPDLLSLIILTTFIFIYGICILYSIEFPCILLSNIYI